MKVLEFEAKALLREHGLRVPQGRWVTTPQAAADAAAQIGGPVVIKAQVPTGGRMKAGGVRFADTPEQAAAIATELLGLTIKGFAVQALLIEEKIPNTAELFVSLTYDSEARSAVLLASSAGGIEIEAETKLVRRLVPTLTAASEYIGREAAAELGLQGAAFLNFSAAVTRLLHAFAAWDALLLEVNPLVLDTSGAWCVADVHLELDDDAAHRQAALLAKLPESRAASDRRTDFERKAAEIDSADHRGVAGRLVPFPGNLGLLIGGGGASLTIMDAVLEAGLKPANYCEIGGNPSVWKIKELTKLILSQPGVDRLAVIMNVVSNTRADLVARGVIKGALELGLQPREVISAFRIPGSWETEGQDLLRHYGIAFYGRETSIDQVVEAMR
ncbi:MAG: ATP-grasp domain-containing protein [Anaerolineales bacterium]